MKRFCGYVAGFVFFISGILKLMDPVGASLVMKEYFHFLHIDFMDFSAMTAGIFFSFAESTIGAGLITGVWRRVVAPCQSVSRACSHLLPCCLWSSTRRWTAAASVRPSI